MDDRGHPHHDAHDLFAREHELLEEDVERDLLDEPVLPLLGLSSGTLLAIFAGGACGTVARYELAANHGSAVGAFPWVTLLVNLTGSLAIGFLVPLTEHVSHRAPLLRPVLWSASSVAGRRTRRWPSTRSSWASRATSGVWKRGWTSAMALKK